MSELHQLKLNIKVIDKTAKTVEVLFWLADFKEKAM